MNSSPDTKAKTQRNENFRKLIGAIRISPLCYDDGAVVLGMHPQSVRLYFSRLLDHRVIVAAGKIDGYRSKKRLWKIVSEESVRKFLLLIACTDLILRVETSAPKAKKIPKAPKTEIFSKQDIALSVRILSRTVHRIKDDEEIPTKLAKGTHVHVQRDPLIEAFFGPARTTASFL